MLNTLNDVLNNVDNFIWGMPLIILILFTGILLTVRLRGLQIRHLGKALHYVFHNEDDGEGEVTSFGALCTALSATIGTGNIVGCATAIVAGGPGALFWMWLAAFFGMATKYAEGMLAVKYRVIAEDGHTLGGPFYYIEKGMGKNFKWLAKLFCVFGTMVGLFGIGTFTQVNGITSAVNNFFDPSNVHTISLFGMNYSISVVVAGIIVTICAGLVIIGGIKRISKVSEVIVPFMAVTYIGVCLIIVFTHLPQVPAAFAEIVQSAFGLKAVAGGAIGAMTVAMQKGIARGIFSNEAGLGSAPIAAAAAQTNEPVRQGLVSMTGTVSCIPGNVRLIRSVVLTTAEQDYVEAAKSYGTSNARIIFRYVLPNAMGPIIVNTTMSISDMMLSAAGLSFIGMGIQPPSPEWGALLSNAQTYLFSAPYMLLFPGMFILLSSLAFNLVGDGLTDALDPKLKD